MGKTILAISGKPGLYELVSRGKGSLIVENLTDHKRMPAFASDRVTSLADIAMYTDDEDMPLGNILIALRDMEGGKKASIDYKKASGKELNDYFAKFVPNFDRDRVHTSDIKKLVQWYNILIEAGVNFEEDLKPTNGDNVEDREENEV
jgi:dephospho-CoA kinase